MQHRDLYPHEILQDVIEKSYAKSEGRLKTLAILSFLGGGYVSFGYMAYLKVVSGIPPEWSGLATLLGAAVFPICLICILIGGGELATGNMMMMALGRLTRRVSFKKLFRNWIVVSLGNLAGALFIAYFLGHLVLFRRETNLRQNPCHVVSGDDLRSCWITTLCRQYVYYSGRNFCRCERHLAPIFL